jgi:putative ABC transport system substrate-binding protein
MRTVRLELLRMLVPKAARVAVLVNPTDRVNAETVVRDLDPAARSIGVQIQTFEASTSGEIDTVSRPLRTHSRTRCLSPAKLISTVGASSWSSRRRTTVSPRLMPRVSYPDIGGLMSYGADMVDAYRQAGAQTGRILKGAKPMELPVVQPSKFQLVINAQTARIFALTLPSSLLSIADEVIE